MQLQDLDPPQALRAAIKSIWHASLDGEELATGFEVLPDGYAEIIFYFGGACSIATSQGWQLWPSPFLVGLLSGPLLLRAPGRLDVIGIKCFPWAVFDLLGLPASRGGVRTVEHPIAQLQAALGELVQAGQVAAALAQAAQYFLDAQRRPAGNELLARAGEAMRAANGALPVREVAAAAHATVRTLERRFKQAAGHTVKDVSALMRFEQVRDHLWQQPAANLAALAQELGYTDQSHLGRDFKRYSGTTPAAFARKIKQAKQAGGPEIVAFLLA